MINDLSLTTVTNINIHVKRNRDMLNRITQFKRQIERHYTEKNYYPAKALSEITRLEVNQQYYYYNYLIKSNIKIQQIKKELNKQVPKKIHWESSTSLDWIQHKSESTDLIKHYLNTLSEQTLKAKKAEYLWRLKQEMEIKLHDNWYIIMNTLTVAPEHYLKIWQKGSKQFSSYIKRFDRISGKENHMYFAVVERGGSNNREHFHIIHMLKYIPPHCKTDPNRSQIHPNRRILDSLREWWQYGFSAPIAVRTSYNDAWGQIGFRWPDKLLDNGTYVPIDSGNAGQLSNYLSKYIVKSINEKGDQIQWKIRQSHHLGRTLLTKLCQQLTRSQLLLLLKMWKTLTLKLHQQTIPPYLIKMAVHRQLLKKWTTSKKTTKLMSLEPQEPLIKRLSNLTQPTHVFNRLNSGASLLKPFTKRDISKIQQKIDQLAIELTGHDELLPTPFILKGYQNV